MNATAKKKASASRAVNTTGWPAIGQMIALALGRAELELQDLIKTRGTDGDWDERDVDIECAVEMSLIHVQNMKDMGLLSSVDFDAEWFRARAPLALSLKTFSRPDSYYARRLDAVVKMFDEASNYVEFAEPRPEDVKLAA